MGVFEERTRDRFKAGFRAIRGELVLPAAGVLVLLWVAVRWPKDRPAAWQDATIGAATIVVAFIGLCVWSFLGALSTILDDHEKHIADLSRQTEPQASSQGSSESKTRPPLRATERKALDVVKATATEALGYWNHARGRWLNENHAPRLVALCVQRIRETAPRLPKGDAKRDAYGVASKVSEVLELAQRAICDDDGVRTVLKQSLEALVVAVDQEQSRDDSEGG